MNVKESRGSILAISSWDDDDALEEVAGSVDDDLDRALEDSHLKELLDPMRAERHD